MEELRHKKSEEEEEEDEEDEEGYKEEEKQEQEQDKQRQVKDFLLTDELERLTKFLSSIYLSIFFVVADDRVNS